MTTLKGWDVWMGGNVFSYKRNGLLFALGFQFADCPNVRAGECTAVIKLRAVQFQQRLLYITARGRRGELKYCRSFNCLVIKHSAY